MERDNASAHGFARGRTVTDDRGAWRTPPDVLADARQIAGWGPWELDLAAEHHNRVADRWCGPGHPTRPDALERGAPGVRDALQDLPDPLSYRRVWCNPPYSKWDAFAEVLADAARKFRIRSAVLVFARTDTAAWHLTIAHATAIAFRCGRVRFLRPDGTPGGTAPAPSALVLFGAPPAARGPITAISGVRWHVVTP